MFILTPAIENTDSWKAPESERVRWQLEIIQKGSNLSSFSDTDYRNHLVGGDVEESPMSGLYFFLGVFIISIGWGAYQKTCPVHRLFNPQGTILTLPYQGIALIAVHWGFHDNIIISFKFLCSIILMVFLIGRIGWWCFFGTCRGCSLPRDLLMNLQNPFNKVVKIFVINFSLNYCLGNCCRSNVQECNQNSKKKLTGKTCLHLLH